MAEDTGSALGEGRLAAPAARQSAVVASGLGDYAARKMRRAGAGLTALAAGIRKHDGIYGEEEAWLGD